MRPPSVIPILAGLALNVCIGLYNLVLALMGSMFNLLCVATTIGCCLVLARLYTKLLSKREEWREQRYATWLQRPLPRVSGTSRVDWDEYERLVAGIILRSPDREITPSALSCQRWQEQVDAATDDYERDRLLAERPVIYEFPMV